MAPFVEEAAKATVLFWLAILMRYAWVSRLSGIVLAGLSAPPSHSSRTSFTTAAPTVRRAHHRRGLPEQALQQTFVLRGLLTFFGHPLFTAMTGIGLAVALRSKSKSSASSPRWPGSARGPAAHVVQHGGEPAVHLPAADRAAVRHDPALLGLVGYVVRQLFSQGRLVRTRLGDYVRVGWLEPDDPQPLSRLRTRLRALWHALFRGPRRSSRRCVCSVP